MTGPAHAPAAERNRGPILEALREVLPSRGRVLEIGSGTAQHAEYFAAELPGLVWQTSDVPEALPAIRERCARAGLANLPPPIAFTVGEDPWPDGDYDLLYSANTAHIMSWETTKAMLAGAGELLQQGGRFCLYGPFRRDGGYSGPGDERFDAGLRAQDPAMGLRDLERVDEVVAGAGLAPVARYAMPANNLLLIWERR